MPKLSFVAVVAIILFGAIAYLALVPSDAEKLANWIKQQTGSVGGGLP